MRYLAAYLILTLLLGVHSCAFAKDQQDSNKLQEEAPTALNIVPWKQRESSLKEQPLRASPVLEQVLEPIDRETLKREIEFHHKTKQQ